MSMNPEPFRNGEDELPVRDRGEDLLADMHGKLKDALLMAGRTEASDLAGEGYKHVMPAVIAADSDKSLTQVTALTTFNIPAKAGTPNAYLASLCLS